MVQQRSIVIASLFVLCPACSDNEPPADRAGPGTIALDLGTGKDSFWIDTDGVAPEVAGCHIEFSDDDCEHVATNARNFGELCQEDGTLVESNPGPSVCHAHDKDIGHPFVVDCVGWCRNEVALPDGQRRGLAAATGHCEEVDNMPCENGFVDSAKCVCVD